MTTATCLLSNSIGVGPNRRLSMRVAAILPVDLVLDGGDVVPARSTDIGMSGICVVTPMPIDGNAVRRLRLTLGRHHLELSVDPRWSSSSAVTGAAQLTGFLFDPVDPGSEAALWNYIQGRGRELAGFLRSCEGLEQTDFQEAFELALATRIRTLDAQQVIYGAPDQESSASIFALFRGSVVLEPVGRIGQTITSVAPGEFFGGTAVLANHAPFERAVAVSDSRVLEFVGYNVEYLLAYKPQLGLTLLRAASFHWMRRFEQMIDTVFSPSREE